MVLSTSESLCPCKTCMDVDFHSHSKAKAKSPLQFPRACFALNQVHAPRLSTSPMLHTDMDLPCARVRGISPALVKRRMASHFHERAHANIRLPLLHGDLPSS